MRRNTEKQVAGFTLVELLAVIGILAVLAGILLPVIAQVRGAGRQTACASNLRQMGLAFFAYTQDYDESAPSGMAPALLSRKGARLNVGWAGRLYPYIKNADVFRCPDDAKEGAARRQAAAVPVSYGLNRNLSGEVAEHAANLLAPSRTVLFFEVTHSTARLTLPDEGLGQRAVPEQLSPVGNGLFLIGWPRWWGHSTYSLVLYATGYLDNYGGDKSGYNDGRNDWYDGPNGRHKGGANFLVADGHTVWLRGSDISAGFSNARTDALQTTSGCKADENGSATFPCAEGTSVQKHRLTFSIR